MVPAIATEHHDGVGAVHAAICDIRSETVFARLLATIDNFTAVPSTFGSM